MWQEFKAECSRCDLCKKDGILDLKAFPILMKSPPRKNDILFVLEAPNRDDTYNPDKKYLTIEPDTDPSGRFFHDLFVNELRFDIQDLFVTNSVLCLPAKNEKNGKYPVTSLQQSKCSDILRRMIDVFNPIIVCPVGGKALLAMRRIDEHGYGSMASAVARPTPWYGRTLFPLYHTSRLARNPRNGRIEEEQRADWRTLRATWDKGFNFIPATSDFRKKDPRDNPNLSMAINDPKIQVFVDDDEGYLKWLDDNPRGLVVNCHKSPTPSYLKLHRSTCHCIGRATRNLTNNQYIKICSLKKGPLAEWAREGVGGQLTSCGACKP